VKQQELQDAFVGLIKEHERIIYKICYLYADIQANRDDLYQEIVVQAWRGYPKFRGDAKFSTWLYQVALNTAMSGFAKEKKSPLVYSTDGYLPEAAYDNTGKEEAEKSAILYAAISKLNDIEKALVMLYLDGKSYEEMEKIMGIPNGALRVKMTRIKDKLKTIAKTN
jgi:RNA polymerase sigma-70 factor, ECF subfamily